MLVSILIFLLFLFFPKNVIAVDTFQLNQKITYTVNQSGQATVEQEMSLTNNLPEIYPTEYEIKTFGSDITNITAFDKNGNILANIEKSENSANIKLKFNLKNVGKGQITPFTVRYNINKFAENKGSVWEINLAEFQNLNESDLVDITLKIPTSFGKLAFSSIKLPEITPALDYYLIHLHQNQIKNKKNLLIFGDYQLFDFNLQYILNNEAKENTATKIALPPNLDSQKITFKTIDPPPEKIDIDQDGNWIASYTLKPNSNLNISVQGQAKIINSRYPGTTLKEHLAPTQFWPSDDETIKNIASTLNNPKNIYDYVLQTLSYNFDGIATASRQGAINALLEPSKALCTEFTDLFITLARAKGIPAREIQGFAYSNNPRLKPVGISADILHAWPQYFDEKQQVWIAIDPTWEKTTNGIDYFNDLDLNHFIFVIHGIDSHFPSLPNKAEVTFANVEILSESTPPKITTNNKSIIIENNTSTPLYQSTLNIPSVNWTHTINFIGPFSKINIPIPKMPLLTKSFTLFFTNNALKHDASYDLRYLIYYQNLLIAIISAIVLLCICGIIITRHEKIS